MLYTDNKFRRGRYNVVLAVGLVVLIWPTVIYWKIKDVITEHKGVLH